MTRFLAFVLAVVVVGLLAAGPLAAPPPLVLVRAGGRVLAGGGPRAALALPPELDAPVERERLSHATPDDLARGLLALSALPGEDPRALSPDQRASLVLTATHGAEARSRRDTLRTEVRRAERAWLESGATLWESIPHDAQAALRVRSIAPPPPANAPAFARPHEAPARGAASPPRPPPPEAHP